MCIIAVRAFVHVAVWACVHIAVCAFVHVAVWACVHIAVCVCVHIVVCLCTLCHCHKQQLMTEHSTLNAKVICTRHLVYVCAHACLCAFVMHYKQAQLFQ